MSNEEETKLMTYNEYGNNAPLKESKDATYLSPEMKEVSKLLYQADTNKDGSLDQFEMHGVLFSRGILVPIDVIMFLFSAADSDNDGKLSLDEFANFLLKPKGSKLSEFFASLLCDIEFWSLFLLAIAGGLFSIAGFSLELSLSSSTAANMYLSGGAMYFTTLVRSCFLLPVKIYNAEKSFEGTTNKLQYSLTRNALSYSSYRRASGISLSCSEMRKHLEKGYGEDACETNDQIYIYLRDVIFVENQLMTKTDLEFLLLREIGSASESLIDAVFEFVDEDGSGAITVDEFFSFIEQLKPNSTSLRRMCSVTRKTLINVPWLMSVVYLFASTVSISHNVVKRFEFGENGLWQNNIVPPVGVVAYGFFIGTLVFSAKAYEHHRSSFDMGEKVRLMLRNWMTQSAQKNTVEWREFQENAGFGIEKLNRLLEESGIFIPRSQLDSIFCEMNVDEDDEVCKEELEAFVDVKRNRMLTIWSLCLTSFMFLSNITWFLGSIGYVMSANMNDAIVGIFALKVCHFFFLNSQNFCYHNSHITFRQEMFSIS